MERAPPVLFAKELCIPGSTKEKNSSFTLFHCLHQQVLQELSSSVAHSEQNPRGAECYRAATDVVRHRGPMKMWW